MDEHRILDREANQSRRASGRIESLEVQVRWLTQRLTEAEKSKARLWLALDDMLAWRRGAVDRALAIRDEEEEA